MTIVDTALIEAREHRSVRRDPTTVAAPRTMPAAPDGPGSGLLALQRRAGNRAVAALVGNRPARMTVQRHAADDDPELMAALARTGTPTEVLGPQPAPAQEVTPAEEEVASDAATAPTAVQRAVGIAKPKTVKAYVKTTAKGLRKLGTGTEPLQSFVNRQGNALNEGLTAHKVHPVPVRLARLGPDGATAHFVPAVWEIVVNEDRVPDPIGVDAGRKLAAQLYHEGRHAEQWFSLIRHVISSERAAGRLSEDNTYSVNELIPAPKEVIRAAFDLKPSKKGAFDKKEKREWARHLYEESVTPAQGLRPATLSAELLAGERAPHQALAVYQVALNQEEALKRVNGGKFTGPALDTTGWSPEAARAVADLWSALVRTAETEARHNGILAPAEVLDPAGVPTVLSLCYDDPGVEQARRQYLRTYGALLKVVLQVTEEAYEQAYKRYQNLPVEKDAFATQDLVEQGLAETLAK